LLIQPNRKLQPKLRLAHLCGVQPLVRDDYAHRRWNCTRLFGLVQGFVLLPPHFFEHPRTASAEGERVAEHALQRLGGECALQRLARACNQDE